MGLFCTATPVTPRNVAIPHRTRHSARTLLLGTKGGVALGFYIHRAHAGSESSVTNAKGPEHPETQAFRGTRNHGSS